MKVDLNKLVSTSGERTITITRADAQETDRCVNVRFSTEQPVITWFGYEILDHSAGAVRMGRITNGAPVLKDHNRGIQTGVVEDAEISDAEKCGRACLRFASKGVGAEEFDLVMEGIRTKVSVGYMRHAVIAAVGDDGKQLMIDGIPVYRTTDWEPIEISTVAIEADTATGVGRAAEIGITDDVVEKIVQRFKEITISNNKQEGNTDMWKYGQHKMNPVVDPPAGGGNVDVAAIRKQEMERINAIDAAAKFAEKVPDVAEIRAKAVNDGWSAERFANEILPKMATAQTVIPAGRSGIEVVGLDGTDFKGFSVTRALSQLATAGVLSGKEKEISDQTNRALYGGQRSAPALTVTVPASYLFAKRDLSPGTFGSGGALVGTTTMTSEMIELLRNKTVLEKAGARLLSGLVGNIAIPKQSGGATVYWLADGATSTKSDQAFGQVAMTPRRLVGQTAFDKALVANTSLSVESFVTGDIQKQMKIAKDAAGISGTGASGQPMGIFNMTGLSTSVTFGAAATYAKVLEFETNVAANNAEVDAMAYITTPGSRGKWKAAAKSGTNNGFIWEPGNIVNGYNAFATNQVPGNKVLYGNFDDAVFGEWAGVDITVDPYTLAGDNKIRVIITLLCDFVVRHTQSFAISTDSGAQ